MAEKSEKSLKKWTDEEIEKLIDLYEENPCLWDIFDKSYQKRDVKERATASIAEDLNREVTDIKAKWNAIRGQFGRELNKALASKSGQSTAELYVSQWTFWERLQFLENVMRKTKKNSRDTLSAEDSLNPSSEEDEISVSDTSVNTATKEMKSVKMKKRKLENTKAELLTSCLSVFKSTNTSTSS